MGRLDEIVPLCYRIGAIVKSKIGVPVDERLMRTIEHLKSWGELSQFEANVKAKGALSEAVVTVAVLKE